MEDDVKTFADYFAILRRRKTMLMMGFLGIALAGVYVIYSIVPTYMSSATFRVQQQSVSEYVETPGTGSVAEQIQLVRQRVMSAENLSAVIDKYGLYPQTTGGAPAGYDAVENLRSAIELVPEYAEVFNPRTSRNGLVTIAFQVQFEYTSPQLAQQVAADIAGLFLSENQHLRVEQSQETIDFLSSELAASEDDVEQTAAALEVFREQHAGNLPDMTDFNLQAMQRVERQIELIDADIRAARDRKQLLEADLADPNLVATVLDENGEPIVGTAQRLAELQRQRLQLLSTYSAQHPDVIRVEKEIEILAKDLSVSGANATAIQQQLDKARTDLSVARQQYAEDHPDVRRLVRSVETLEGQLQMALQQRATPNVNIAAQDPVVQQIYARIRAQESDISTFQQRRAELVAQLAEYERKMLRMPQIEREYARLTRDSEAAVARYTAARQKLDEAKTAGKLEAEGGGARFILTDPPRLPEYPVKPNRTSLLIICLVVAAVLSIGAALAFDSMDGTIKEAGDILRISSAPPIAVIPFIETVADHRKRIGVNIAMSAFVAVCVGLAIFIAQHSA